MKGYRTSLICSLLLFVLILFVSCTSREENVKTFLSKRGYTVESYCGKVEEYVLSEELLKDKVYSLQWQSQAVDFKEYFRDKIEVEKLIVRNHPLDNWKAEPLVVKNVDGNIIYNKENNMVSKGKTEIYLFIARNKIVGGRSFPVLDQHMLGDYEMIWTIDGVRKN